MGDNLQDQWVMVPGEPTDAMVRAGQLGVTTSCTKAIYAAMLAAAPQQAPAAPSPDDEQRDMAILDRYAEVATALGFEGDAWFGDPLASHAEIVARATALRQQPVQAAPGAVAWRYRDVGDMGWRASVDDPRRGLHNWDYIEPLYTAPNTALTMELSQ